MLFFNALQKARCWHLWLTLVILAINLRPFEIENENMSSQSEREDTDALIAKIEAAKAASKPKVVKDGPIGQAQFAWRMVVELVTAVGMARRSDLDWTSFLEPCRCCLPRSLCSDLQPELT